MRPEKQKALLASVPDGPGVYLMKDADGEIIYIGKASSLKKRVSSYFQKKDHDPKTRVLVKKIEDMEYILTDTEVEALLLESGLIKKHRPRFNVRLKDDKRYPYIGVTLEEEYPRVIYTRKIRAGVNRYYGPYTDAAAAKNIVAMVNRIFKLRTCTRELPLKKNERPCLNYQMKKCSGVCTGEISADEYRSLVDKAVRFLDGEIEPVLADLGREMNGHAENFRYEKAASLRDIIFDVQRVSENQKVDIPAGIDQDYIGVSLFGEEAIVVLFEFRRGALLGRKISIFDNADYADPGEIIRTFMIDYYTRSEVPQKIVVQHLFSDLEVIEKYLSGRSSKKTAVAAAKSRDERGVIAMIGKNIDMVRADREIHKSFTERDAGLGELMEVLGLGAPPSVIECFDISNFHGKDAVASMVSFSDGLPNKSGYRRFRIRGYDAPDDPAMIHEAVARRVQHLVNEGLPFPDLMVIDGGPTQLSRAREAAANFTGEIPIVSLAKRFEEIYTGPGTPPIRLPKDSPALHILQNIRDEAHRFAITYHRGLRDRRTTSSALDSVPGIGPSLKKTLFEHFKSMEAIEAAPLEELQKVPGVGAKTAKLLYRHFRGE
ncbi:MAG TPA: excinuclease ABC subunit UvrC [Spirochaetota bacterium]|nr:excinuclease ABC subunit UvrC [Spirochaetota bacterium]HPI90147.1 excinuclease ABC subunit UvrC [Spirochaetota bacterium]HPR48906.1 excinuclease ABC subunit UvrC [Spirochaetota bacterium]